MTVRLLFLLGTILLLNVGCGGEQPYRTPTVPTKGKVTVDGQAPGSAIQVQCHPVNGMDSEHPSVSSCETDAEGNFSIATYESGDGIPAGDYVLTFTWQDFNVMSRSYTGPDKLNELYSDPATSPIKLTVKAGEEIEMPVVELKTK